MSKAKKTTKKKRTTKKSKAKTRYDGRKANELRPTTIESGVLPNADGSAYIEMGRNKILVGVFGPREMHPRRFAKPNEATLRCRYHMSPFSVDPRRSPAPSRRDVEIGMVMSWAIQPAVFLEKYPRSVIDVYCEVLEADGGTRTACINAATVALVDAGIPMRDLVSSCAAGVMDGKVVLDLGDYEDKEGEADVPVAYMPKLGKITLLQMDGVLPVKTFTECVDLAIEGCLQVNEIQREALKKKYGISEEAEE
ncbi:MAG: exosome complex exonuclease Rrp41 [Candidatus Bathyarchaeota archaeon]|nr:exosome complex exonuclease Rrp41 [Candidatus Bathyarchaeota archaeon]